MAISLSAYIFQVADKSRGRLHFELFQDLAPKAAESFRQLCIGHSVEAWAAAAERLQCQTWFGFETNEERRMGDFEPTMGCELKVDSRWICQFVASVYWYIWDWRFEHVVIFCWQSQGLAASNAVFLGAVAPPFQGFEVGELRGDHGGRGLCGSIFDGRRHRCG